MPLSPALLKQPREAAPKGGAATLERHGRVHFSELGKRGGRPTFEEALEKARSRSESGQASRGSPGRPKLRDPFQK